MIDDNRNDWFWKFRFDFLSKNNQTNKHIFDYISLGLTKF